MATETLTKRFVVEAAIPTGGWRAVGSYDKIWDAFDDSEYSSEASGVAHRVWDTSN